MMVSRYKMWRGGEQIGRRGERPRNQVVVGRFPVKVDPGFSKVLVVGGATKGDGTWVDLYHRYDGARVLELDLETGEHKVVLEHHTPPEAAPDDDPSITFKTATVVGDVMYACTQTEVMAFSLPDFRQTWYCSIPRFNDVHHVLPAPEGYFVANTGLDEVLLIDRDGTILESFPTTPADQRRYFDDSIDWRKVASTKPHISHPNNVFQTGDATWALRLNFKDAICLEDPSCTLPIEVQRPHDGLVRGDDVWFTTVDGHLVGVPYRGGERREVEISSKRVISGSLGWCRGLWISDTAETALVGFSQLRHTTDREKVSWVESAVGRVKNELRLPTRVSLIDVSDGSTIQDYDLEPELAAVFSIHPLARRPEPAPAQRAQAKPTEAKQTRAKVRA